MTMQEYELQAAKTAVYPNRGKNLIYAVLGLAGEAGELANRLKKVLRDDGGILSSEAEADIAKELGDVLWYVAATGHEIGWTLDEVAQANLRKLADRQQAGTIHGSGDNR